MNFRRTLLLPAVSVIFCAASAAQTTDSIPSTQVNVGDLQVTFRDNSQSPGILSGIDKLINVAAAAGFDAYDPDGRGASAGLNFEHIISGHRSEHNKFTPRHGPYRMTLLPNENAVILRRTASDSPWRVASTLKYTVVAPHFIDFEFRCTPQDAALFGDRQYALFFFANYMNDVEDVALHFRGKSSADSPEQWIAADAPEGHPDWNQGGNYRALHTDDLAYDDDVRFRLNTWSYDWPRITQPFYYGRAARGMTLILMFDRLTTETDQIRFSLYKFKVPRHPRPAWDFQYVVNPVQSDQEYGFRGRLVWKKFVSADDCQREYETWAQTLPAE